MLATLDQRADAFRRSIRANVHYWRALLLTPPAITTTTDHVWQSVIRAILFACEEPTARVEAAHLAIGLFQLMQHRGAWHEWRGVLQWVADALNDEPALRSRVLGQAGQCLFLEGRPGAAVEVLEEAEQLAVAVRVPELMVRNRVSLAESLRLMRRYEPAERKERQALDDLTVLPETPPFRLVRMAAFTTLGMVLGYSGQPDEGLHWLHQAARLAEADGRPIEVSRILNNIAHVLWTADRLPEALPVLDRATAALKALPSADFERATINLTRGAIHAGLGQLSEAEVVFQTIEVDELRRQGYRPQFALATYNLGNLFQLRGRLLEAEDILTEALVLQRELDDDVELARFLLALGEVLDARGKRSEAEPLWREAVGLAENYPADTWARRYVATGRTYLTPGGRGGS